jgi:hypothetical protein
MEAKKVVLSIEQLALDTSRVRLEVACPKDHICLTPPKCISEGLSFSEPNDRFKHLFITKHKSNGTHVELPLPAIVECVTGVNLTVCGKERVVILRSVIVKDRMTSLSFPPRNRSQSLYRQYRCKQAIRGDHKVCHGPLYFCSGISNNHHGTSFIVGKKSY